MARPREDLGPRFERCKRIVGACWIWTGSKTHDGYGVFAIGRKQWRVHRASYAHFVGIIPNGLCVCHTCDTPLCFNPAHLFLGTIKDNTQDMIAKGRRALLKGEQHPLCKLTDVEVMEIKALRRQGIMLRNLAVQYGVSFQHISALCRGVVRAT